MIHNLRFWLQSAKNKDRKSYIFSLLFLYHNMSLNATRQLIKTN